MALNAGIQTYQILTNDDEVCIPSLSNILLAVFLIPWLKYEFRGGGSGGHRVLMQNLLL